MTVRFPFVVAFLASLILSGCFTTKNDSSSPTPEGLPDEVPSSEIGVGEQPSAPPSVDKTPAPEQPVSEIPEASPYGASFEESTIDQMTKAPSTEPAPPVDEKVERAKSHSNLVVRYVTAKELPVRAKPNLKSKSIRTLHHDEAVDVQIKGQWAKLDDGNWVRSQYLTSVAPKVVTKPSKYKNMKLHTTHKTKAEKAAEAKKHKAKKKPKKKPVKKAEPSPDNAAPSNSAPSNSATEAPPPPEAAPGNAAPQDGQ